MASELISAGASILSVLIGSLLLRYQQKVKVEYAQKLEQFKSEVSEAASQRHEIFKGLVEAAFATVKSDLQAAEAAQTEVFKATIQDLARDLGLRKQALVRIKNSAKQALAAAQRMADHNLPSDRQEAISVAASALAEIGLYFATLGSAEVNVYLQADEREECESLGRCLSEFFLTLDFDGAMSEGSAYVERLRERVARAGAAHDSLERALVKPFHNTGNFQFKELGREVAA